MKLLTLLLFTSLAPLIWSVNFKDAEEIAKKEHKMIFVNFSGSDWCGPCIRLRKEILESTTFEKYATDHLVLVRADFPRQKKNNLSKEQTKLNEQLADKYNPEGKFPFSLLLDEDGKIIKEWDGYPKETADQFVEQINKVSVGRK